jgi:hypothetical protein
MQHLQRPGVRPVRRWRRRKASPPDPPLRRQSPGREPRRRRSSRPLNRVSPGKGLVKVLVKVSGKVPGGLGKVLGKLPGKVLPQRRGAPTTELRRPARRGLHAIRLRKLQGLTNSTA